MKNLELHINQFQSTNDPSLLDYAMCASWVKL